MLRTRLNDALKESMKAKDTRAVATLRLILAALKDRDIAARAKGNSDGVDQDEILDMLQKMVRQRRESMALYERGGRPDLVEKEGAEIEIIQRFLPQPMGEAELEEAIDGLIGELQAEGIKDMGRVMGALKLRYAGRMDFARASAVVKDRLS